MDCVTLHGQHKAHTDVPYMAHKTDLAYDYQGFRGFPLRKGFRITSLQRSDGTTTTATEHAAIFQSWCFLGLAIDFFKSIRVDLTVEDCLVYREDGAACLSMHRLSSLSSEMEMETRTMPLEGRARIFSAVKPCLVTAGNVVRKLAKERGDWQWHAIHLSTVILGEYLTCMMKSLLELTDPTPDPWFGRSILASDLMDEAHWCPSVLKALLDQEVYQSSIYYLTKMNRRGIDKDHSLCDSDCCILDMLDHAKYKTRHADMCQEPSECSSIILESAAWILLTDLVAGGQVPLITVDEGKGDFGSLKVNVMTSKFHLSTPERDVYRFSKRNTKLKPTGDLRPYICISHVWSE